MGNRWGKSGNGDRFYFLWLKIHCSDCSCAIKKHLLLGKKAMANLGSVLKSRDVSFLTKVCVCVCVLLNHVQLFAIPWTCSLPNSSAHGIFQARIQEWVAIPFSRGSSWPRDRTPVFCIASRVFTVWAIREASKGPYGQSYGFSSSHVWMWELDHKESWAPKNWCFLTEALEKTLESPLNSRRSN